MRCLKALVKTWPSLLPMELEAMTAAVEGLPLWAIERAVRRVVTGTDGRTLEQASFPPKAPQLAILARAIVGFETARLRAEAIAATPAPKQITSEKYTPEQMEAAREKLAALTRRSFRSMQ
jgi:hypothetical protein